MNSEQNPQEFRLLRSLTRVLVGGLLLGSDALDDRLRTWDGDPTAEDLPLSTDESQTPREFDSLPEKLPPPQVHAAAPQKTIDLRHTVIGVIFEGEEKLEQGLTSLKRSGDIVNRAAVPILKPLQKIGKTFPGQKGFDQLVQRGQSKVDRWENRGREEETKSRQLAQEAATSTVDQSILYMAENKAITELIQTQGMSLAEQILELVRSDAVSADYFFEGLVRYVLRRKPRYLMSPPDLKVQEQATWTLRDIRHKDL